jgi:hypothetical protein
MIMSGGYFDYNQYKLQNIADDLRNLVEEDERLGFVEDKQSLFEEIDKLINMLDYSSKIIHHIDYLLSDDISEEVMWKRINDVKKEKEL